MALEQKKRNFQGSAVVDISMRSRSIRTELQESKECTNCAKRFFLSSKKDRNLSLFDWREKVGLNGPDIDNFLLNMTIVSLSLFC